MLTWQPNSLLIFILGILTLAWLAEPAMQARSAWPLYRTFLWPGVLIHELSHAIMAKILGAKIYEIVLWEKSGGHVTHGPTKLPWLGNFLVGIAPIFGGFLIYTILGYFLLGPELSQPVINLVNYPWNLNNWWLVIQAIPWFTWQAYVWLFFVLNMGVAIAPSWSDLENGRIAGGILLLFSALIGLTEYNHFLTEQDWLNFLAGTIILAVAILLVVVGFWGGASYLRRRIIGR